MFCPILGDWRQFLATKCEDYPEEDITKDAKFLAEQNLGPCVFDSLIKLFDRGNPLLQRTFEKFALGNLVCFRELKDFTRL
jgi:hypothetical protein